MNELAPPPWDDTVLDERDRFSLPWFRYLTRGGKELPYLTPLDFGGVGDGEANDSQAWIDAIAAAEEEGIWVINGLGLTYKLDSQVLIEHSNLIIENAVFDHTGFTGTDAFLIRGSIGSALTLNANAVLGARAVVLANASSIAAGDYVWITSDKIFSNAGSAQPTVGEIKLVRSKSGAGSNQLNLMGRTYHAYNTADDAQVEKINFVENVWFRNVRGIGAGKSQNQKLLRFIYCKSSGAEDVSGVNYYARGITLETCLHCHVVRPSFRQDLTVTDVNGYGVGIFFSSDHCSVTHGNFEYLRHGVATGGEKGVVRNCKFQFNNIRGCSNAGMDGHPASDRCDYSHNTVSVDDIVVSGESTDGLVYQGGNLTAIGNVFRGNFRNGIFHQSFVVESEITSTIIGNDIFGGTHDAAGTMIKVTAEQAANFKGVVIQGNAGFNVFGSAFVTGIDIFASAGNFDDVMIANNRTPNVSGDGIRIRTASGFSVEQFVIAGNCINLSASSTDNCIDMVGANADEVRYGVVTSNFLLNGNTSIFGSNTNNIRTDNNVTRGAGTIVNVAGGASSNGTNI